MSGIIRFEREGVRGFLHAPAGMRNNGLVLTHGAGGNCDAPLLVAIAAAFAAAGVTVLRCDLPFRQRRAKGPPSPSTASGDRAGLRRAVLALRQQVSGLIALGGQSYGGRQATMLAAEEPEIAASLLLFSYPLHPPGRPERQRTEHFPRLINPCVFVHGDADPFGSLNEMRSAVASISSPVQVIAVAAAGHDLRRGHFDAASVIAATLEQLAR